MASTIARPRAAAAPRVRPAQVLGRAGLYLLLAVLGGMSMFPFLWTFLSSGKEVSEFYQIPPSLFPIQPRFVENYREIWTRVPFGLWLWNTFFVTVMALIGTTFSASLVAYSFARFNYPGRDAFFMVTLSTMILKCIVDQK